MVIFSYSYTGNQRVNLLNPIDGCRHAADRSGRWNYVQRRGHRTAPHVASATRPVGGAPASAVRTHKVKTVGHEFSICVCVTTADLRRFAEDNNQQTLLLVSYFLFLPARHSASAGTIAMAVCLCLSVSVTSRCSIELDGRIDPVFDMQASCDQS